MFRFLSTVIRERAQVLVRLGVVLGLSALSACGPAEPDGCEVGERVFPVGATWTCEDGCNFCSCMLDPDGEVSVGHTLKHCGGEPGPQANKLVCWDEGAHLHGESWSCGVSEWCTCHDGKTERTVKR